MYTVQSADRGGTFEHDSNAGTNRADECRNQNKQTRHKNDFGHFRLSGHTLIVPVDSQSSTSYSPTSVL